jgi:hypothetical protein
MPMGGRTEGQTERRAKDIGVFRDYAIAPKKKAQNERKLK